MPQFSDDFNRATLGSDWDSRSTGSWTIEDNALAQETGFTQVTKWHQDADTDQQFSEITYRDFPTTAPFGPWIGPCVLMPTWVSGALSAQGEFYMLLIAGDPPNQISIRRKDDQVSSDTTLGSVESISVTEGDRFRLEVDGTDLVGYQNDTEVIRRAMSLAPLTTGGLGVGMYCTNQEGARFDDWEGGDVDEPEPPPVGDGIAFWQSEIDSLPTSGDGWTEFDSRTSSDAGTPDLTDQNSDTARNVMLQALRWRMDGGGVGKSAIESKLLAFPGDEDVDSLGVFRQMYHIVIAADLIDMDIDTPTVTNAESQTVTFREWLEEMMTKEVGDHSRWDTIRNTAVGFSGARATYSNYGAYARTSYMALAYYVGTTAQQDEAVASLRQMLGNYQGQDGFEATADFDDSWVNGSSYPATFGINPVSDGSVYSGLIYEDASRQTSEGGSAGPNFDPAPAQSWGVSYSLHCWEGLMASAVIASHNGHPDIWQEADSALDRAIVRIADEGNLNDTDYTRFSYRDLVRFWNKVYQWGYTELSASNNSRFVANPEIMLAGDWPMGPTLAPSEVDVDVDGSFSSIEGSVDIEGGEPEPEPEPPIPSGPSAVFIGNRELDFINGSLRITHAVETRCSMRCNIESDIDLELLEGEPVEILINSERVFKGVMLKPVESYPGPHNRIYQVEGTCYGYIAERRTMSRGYINTNAGSIVSSIISEFLADEGITEGVIVDGPNVTEALFSWISVSQALDSLAERAGFWWHINGDKVLNFGPPSTFPAPFDLDEIDEHATSVAKAKGNRDYRNRQYVRGGKAETEERTESWKGDGDQRTFVTGFPIAREPIVTVNGTPQTVDVKGIGDQNAEWFWARGSSEVTQNSSDTPLGSSDVLSISYTGLIDFVAVSRDQAEVERRKAVEDFGSGIVDNVLTDTSVTNTASAFEVAAGKLNKFAIEGRSLDWTTEKKGLSPGQLITVNLPEIGFDGDQLLITTVEVSNKAARLQHRVHAVEGPVDNNWAKWFGDAAKPLDPLFFRENIGEEENIIILADFTENWGWSEEQNETIHACSVPSVSLNPSATLFPC